MIGAAMGRIDVRGVVPELDEADWVFFDVKPATRKWSKTMTVPACPKIYHIVHVDRLSSIIEEGGLLCDAEVVRRDLVGTSIGINHIKQRRLTELTLTSHSGLHVGDCVPFYFCPRSVMLYMFYRGNSPDIIYRGGQMPIVHLEADLHTSVDWCNKNGRRWAFTTSNAGSRYFDDYSDLDKLDRINWTDVHANSWNNCKETKQAEFLIEASFTWSLFERIGVYDETICNKVQNILTNSIHCPNVEKIPAWYY
jgi:hypothetical protein